MKDYYSILGIPRYSTEQTIKEAYRRLAKRWHPDANGEDEHAQRMMQDLNRAKEVLFDPETREEYRRVLEMQDALTAENIQRLRKKWSENRFSEVQPSTHKPFASRRFIFLMGLISLAAGIAIFRLAQVSESKQTATDPIDNIIKRNSMTDFFPAHDKDSIVVPDVPNDRLGQMAAALAMMDEYRSAAKYWEKYLERDPHDLEVATNLMLAYLHRDDYARAVEAIRDHVVGDTNLVTIYSALGDYFRTRAKPFDAEDAYKKVLEIGMNIPLPSRRIQECIARAKKSTENR